MANKLDQLVLHAPQRGTVTYISYRTERRGAVIPADADRMEENIGPGGYQAMVGHGGITCKVIRGGQVSIGDELAVLDV
jgi:hypothetical protein